MADDLQYASRPDGKRKFDDPAAAPPPRRPTGFSAPIASPSPDNKAPAAAPPMDEIELAKQRAQEIASRLFTNAEAKRPRLENSGFADESGDKGYGSVAYDHSQKPLAQPSPSQVGMNLPSSFPSYGYQGSSKKIEIPNGRVGVIIGKGGETIRYLQLQSGAKIQVTRDMDHDPYSHTRPVELVGTPEQISKAEQLINDVLAEAESGGSGIIAARKSGVPQAGAEQFIMNVPNNKVGLVIGKGGETIKNMQAKSGARIQLIPLHPPPGDTSTERTVQIDGTKEQIELAKQLVNEVISENRMRNPQMTGGYRPPRPPTSWTPPGAPQMQQPGYGYMQPGTYPGPPPPYNMSQPPYGGYPPPPASGGFTSGWDQSSNPAAQQTMPGAGYDYYNQQPPPQQQQQQQPQPPVDNSSYNYSQPPANYNSQGSYGDSTYPQSSVGQQQGYGQDGYAGGYHTQQSQPGYAQTVSNPQTGYDQQQGYGTTPPTYGAISNPSQDGSAPTYGAQTGPTAAQQAPPPVHPSVTQGYAGQQPTASTASYPSQGTAQAGYGVQPASQPGYGSQPPAQPGYGHPTPSTQPSYGQPLQGQKPSPTSAVYGQAQQSPTAQSGYVQPSPGQAGYPHGQPPPAQSGYVQDPTHYRPPGFASGGPQPAYGQQQSYGAPPQSQPSYGQQQQQAYGDSYNGTGYSQPPAYSNDNSVHGTYDAPAANQAVPSGVTKASPQS